MRVFVIQALKFFGELTKVQKQAIHGGGGGGLGAL